jgi:cation diffusion facilitator family transporter
MSTDYTQTQAHKDKGTVALTSVFAAIGLTTFKLVIGLLTNSLGILAEAAHSGLDLVAALVTLFAVRISGKPADKEHHYGHGKVENLSALFETLLLLLTCVWIIYEALQRLFFRGEVAVDPSFWAFLIMVTSIVVDYNRSRMLYRAARKYRSQALEADALHFSTDIWSSSVVIFGLFGVVLGNAVSSLSFLKHADAIAALGVAMIVVYVSIELGIRTVKALLDTAPVGVAEKISEAVEAVPGVKNCHHLRVRYAGAHSFVDVHVLVDGNQTLNQAHELTEVIERAIQKVSPDADVTVHPEPFNPAAPGSAVKP